MRATRRVGPDGGDVERAAARAALNHLAVRLRKALFVQKGESSLDDRANREGVIGPLAMARHGDAGVHAWSVRSCGCFRERLCVDGWWLASGCGTRCAFGAQQHSLAAPDLHQAHFVHRHGRIGGASRFGGGASGQTPRGSYAHDGGYAKLKSSTIRSPSVPRSAPLAVSSA